MTSWFTRKTKPESDIKSSTPPIAVESSTKPIMKSEPRPEPQPMRMIRLNLSFARFVGRIPPAVVKVPSMITVPEKRLLYGLAHNRYSGEGIIVDVGIFLGASTRCFGEGLRANANFQAIRKRWQKPIVSFERGVVNPTMPAFFQRNKVKVTAQPGESFADEVRKNVEPVADLVDLRIGDILETAKGLNKPIEILFLDIIKASEISKFAIRTFFPHLIPGLSIVIQQDYFDERHYYIKTDQEFFAEFFIYLGEVGTSAAFLCSKAIPPEMISKLEAGLRPDEQERLASIAMQRSVDPARRFLMALSKLRLILELHDKDAAKAYLEFVKGEFPEQIADTRYGRLSESLEAAEKLCKGGILQGEF